MTSTASTVPDLGARLALRLMDRLRRTKGRPAVDLLAKGVAFGCRHRMVQFCVVAGVIFAATPRASDREVQLTRSHVGALRDADLQKGGRSAPIAEIEERALEDEILYREGLKLGFDKNDNIIRQRMIQKVLFLAEELAGAAKDPTDAELRTYFEQTRDRWKRPEQLRLRHVFRTRAESLQALDGEIRRIAEAGGNPATLGEPCPVPAELTLTREQVATTFGADFAKGLDAQATGGARGFGPPIASAFGWHRVEIVERNAQVPASFEEVKTSLREIYVVARRESAVASYLEKAFAGYDVSVDGKRVAAIQPVRRVASRPSGSGED